jgi:hypothetical protein
VSGDSPLSQARALLAAASTVEGLAAKVLYVAMARTILVPLLREIQAAVDAMAALEGELARLHAAAS